MSMEIYLVQYGCYCVRIGSDVYFFDAATPVLGYSRVIPFLYSYLGARDIRAIWVSHYHFNHVGGTIPLLRWTRGNIEAIRTNGVYSSGQTGAYLINDPKTKTELYEQLDRFPGVAYEYHKHGESVTYSNGLKVEVWSPLDQYADHGGYTANPNGPSNMIVRCVYGDFTILFPGDMNKPNELLEVWSAVENHPDFDLSAKALAWFHHGDDNAADDDVIDPLGLEIVFLERDQPVSYLDNKGIPYLLRESEPSNLPLGIKAQKDGSWEVMHGLPSGSDMRAPRIRV